MEHSQMTSLYTHDESSFDNRIFRYVVISPAGRTIRDFRSIRELLEAIRDAIKAHRSLYTDRVTSGGWRGRGRAGWR